MPDTVPLLEARALRHRFSTASQETLRGVTLEVGAGELIGLIGPGGSGKTVLLRCLGGLLSPSAGEVRFLGEPLASWLTRRREKALRRHLGMSFQSGGLFDSLSAEENLAFAARELLDLQEGPALERAHAALQEVGLLDARRAAVESLSGGMQRRLGLARALIPNPRLALLDDPTAGLDPVTSRAITELIKEVSARHGTTVVIATTDVARAFEIGDRVAFLWEGVIAACAPPAELRQSRERSLYQFLRGLSADGQGPERGA